MRNVEREQGEGLARQLGQFSRTQLLYPGYGKHGLEGCPVWTCTVCQHF